ncbi:MAG: carboxylating nicotinate-nucleotide diphosphorylase [bacterium]|nr:carboxylating nicotinate-nucleotide diphosphorylase [bacterium]
MECNIPHFSEFNQSVNQKEVKRLIAAALSEDIGSGDITTSSIVSDTTLCTAQLVAKSAGIIAGLPLLPLILGQKATYTFYVNDGAKLKPGSVIAEIESPANLLLSRERVLLNFIQRLSGIATLTRRYVDAVNPYPVKILDTRKTTPLLRSLEKYAVRVGGGYNHRFGLYDQILIKDNHIAIAGSITEAVARVRKSVKKKNFLIEVETKNLKEVQEAMKARVDIIMLDNMPIPKIKEAVNLIREQALIEVSGGVTLKTVRAIAKTGVDMISVGALTHSSPALDISLEIQSN